MELNRGASVAGPCPESLTAVALERTRSDSDATETPGVPNPN
jgi:hypothetical protein